jgi:hypothetical protein
VASIPYIQSTEHTMENRGRFDDPSGRLLKVVVPGAWEGQDVMVKEIQPDEVNQPASSSGRRYG